MGGLKLAAVVAVALVARSTAAAAEVEAPPPSRGGLMLGCGLGLTGVTGKLADPNTAVIATDGMDTMFSFRLRLGVALNSQVAVFSEGYLGTSLSVDGSVTAPFFGAHMGSAGAGVALFGEDYPLQASLTLDYGTVGRPALGALSNTPAQDSNLWLAELSLGSNARRGRVDRSWSLSLFAGEMAVGGWLAGLSIMRTWSIFSQGA